ncbi:MAG: hypothetical protein KGQ70_08045, partial [Alphaproteobacteria bacterium]|nr:hypothetical protein [Alphaproteobacteria bacterium]
KGLKPVCSLQNMQGLFGQWGSGGRINLRHMRVSFAALYASQHNNQNKSRTAENMRLTPHMPPQAKKAGIASGLLL